MDINYIMDYYLIPILVTHSTLPILHFLKVLLIIK